MFSMTGFGKAEAVLDGRELTIELKSVNHRFLDLNIKIPRIFNSSEDGLRKVLTKNLSRGHVDVYVNYIDKSNREKTVDVDFALAKGYLAAARGLEKEFFLETDFTLTSLMRIQDIVSVNVREDDEKILKDFVEKTALAACENLNKMRLYEGGKLKNDLIERIDNVEKLSLQVQKMSAGVASDYAEKLKARIKEALCDVKYDESKFLNEVAFFVDKSNIDEEISRLFSHISHFREILREDIQVGRKLDFLVQELNREANTICSKSNNAELTSIGLLLKNEIEKIREQVQNAE